MRSESEIGAVEQWEGCPVVVGRGGEEGLEIVSAGCVALLGAADAPAVGVVDWVLSCSG